MVERKATDVLLSLEEKVNSILAYQRNTDNNIKILLARMNDFFSKGNSVATSPPVINPAMEAFENRPKTNAFERLAAENQIPVSVSAPVQSQAQSDDIIDSPIRMVTPRGQRTKTEGNAGKSVISQKLMSDGSPLFLATVEVLEAGQVIKQIRTNTQGKWQTPLGPGQYTVRVLKHFPTESGKKSIDESYNINVSPSDGPLELDPITFSDGNV